MICDSVQTTTTQCGYSFSSHYHKSEWILSDLSRSRFEISSSFLNTTHAPLPFLVHFAVGLGPLFPPFALLSLLLDSFLPHVSAHESIGSGAGRHLLPFDMLNRSGLCGLGFSPFSPCAQQITPWIPHQAKIYISGLP